jgi:hypothetical protein
MPDEIKGWKGWSFDRVTGRRQWEATCEKATPLGNQVYRLHKPQVTIWHADQHGQAAISSETGEVRLRSLRDPRSLDGVGGGER